VSASAFADHCLHFTTVHCPAFSRQHGVVAEVRYTKCCYLLSSRSLKHLTSNLILEFESSLYETVKRKRISGYTFLFSITLLPTDDISLPYCDQCCISTNIPPGLQLFTLVPIIGGNPLKKLGGLRFLHERKPWGASPPHSHK